MCRIRFDVRLKPTLLGAMFSCAMIPAALNAEERGDSVEGKAGDEVAAAAADQFFTKELKPFLENYCHDCHSGEGAEADVDFSLYESRRQLIEQRPRWEQVRGMIEIGAMPPADHDPLPSMEQREKIADWIDRQVNSVDCDLVHDPGRVTMRRLNNVEYDNTLRDLLGIDFSPSSIVGFPSDGVGNGFDNQGDVLSLSPLQLEKYLQAAQLVTDRIIVHDRESLRARRVEVESLFATEKSTSSLEFGDGEYEVKVRMEYGDNDEQQVPVALLIDNQEIERWNVSGIKKSFRINHKFTAGKHDVTLFFVEDPNTEQRGDAERRIEIDSLELTGPSGTDPPLPAPHRRLFTHEPSAEMSTAETAAAIVQPLLRRAFRREPRPIDVQRVVNLIAMAVEQGETFEHAVGYGLQSILVSPHFLFRVENESAADAADGAESLGDYPLASRLSYFLWASMPDDELLDLARAGTLHEPQVLKAQAARLLRDPRSESLVERFFGQLLGLDNLKKADPDQKQFPLWNDRLRDAMLAETHRFCREIVERDLPLSTLLNGDFTYVNPRLAELYNLEFDGQQPEQLYRQGPGLPANRKGDSRAGTYTDEQRWIRIDLPKNRSGVLTQASVLTLTSYPTSTSPVKRGKWILESILGDPPPPAPPNVPTFEETQKEHRNVSLREQLAIHRENPSCASCHNVMDPLGLGFEHFDAVGAWRDRDGKHPIDAAGQLADGRAFNGSAELAGLIETRVPEIARHFAGNLLTYALGRGLEPSDQCAVDEIVEQAQKNDYRVSSFITAVVACEPFHKRRIQAKED